MDISIVIVQELEILEVDNTTVKDTQINRLNSIKKSRSNKNVKHALKQLTNACSNKKQNNYC